MSVYVDSLLPCIKNRNWRWNKSCHLVADTLEELHCFASKLGMKRCWFRNHPRLPHYDLTEGFRYKAVKFGANEITRTEIVKMMRKGNYDYV